MNKAIREILKVVIVIGLVIAVFMGYQRYDFEGRNKNVEIAVNLNDIQNYASRSGRDLTKELALFKAPGTTTILYKEETVADLKNYISIYNGPDFLLQIEKLLDVNNTKLLLQKDDLRFNYTYILVQQEDVYNRMVKHISAKAPEAYLSKYQISLGENKHPAWLIITSLNTGAIADLGMGFDSNLISYLEKINLQVLPQIRSWNNAKPEGMKAVFSDLEGHQNVKTILFNDKNLPGYPEKTRLYALADMIKAHGWNVGLIEFMPQAGFNAIAYANDKRVVRFFSIDQREGEKITPQDAIDKYTLAASERNDKIIYVRPLPFNNVDQEQGYIEHIDSLRRGLIAQNQNVTLFKENLNLPLSKYPVEFFVLIMSLAVISGGLLLADKLGLLKWGVITAFLVLLVDVYLIFYTKNEILAKLPLAEKGMALLGSIIFPTLAVLSTVSEERRGVLRSLGTLIKASLISLIGAAFTIGFLADKAYMVKINQFQGVKLAHLAPIAIVLLFLFIRDENNKDIIKRAIELLKQQLTVGYAILGIVLLAAAAIYIARTGNEATGLVSGVELKLRALLDQLLYVRPRTKEFLIGHPFMLLAYYFGYRFRYLPIFALGVIGQVSMVDTFAHIHTPIFISLLRTLNGMWLGVLIGLALIAALLYIKNWGEDSQ